MGQPAHGTVVTHDVSAPLLVLNQLESISRDCTGGSGENTVGGKDLVSARGTAPHQKTDQKRINRTHGHLGRFALETTAEH